MSYNLALEKMIDAATTRLQNLEKKKLFGGVCWMLKGNMSFGIYKDCLIVRMDKEEGDQRLKDPNVLPFDITGKPMAGWIMVKEAGWKNRLALETWITIGKKYALSLPKKEKAKPKKTKTLREYRG